MMTPRISKEEKSCQYNLEQILVLCLWSSKRIAHVFKLLFGKVCYVKD